MRGASEFAYYNQINNIIDIGASDGIFYVDETLDERYELFFGDGVVGKALENDEFVEVSYLVSNGAANGAAVFTFSGVLVDDNWYLLSKYYLTL